MSGFTLSHRDKWGNPVFRNLLEAGIWSWMCDTAAWKETKIRFSGKLITLKRGQIAVSERFISEGFGIGRQVVRTFLDNIEKDQMITREITQSITVITVCNYDKYQVEEKPSNPPENQEEAHQLTHIQPSPNPNKKEGNEYNKENTDDEDARQIEVFLTPEIDQKLVDDIYQKVGKIFNSPDKFYITAPIISWLRWGADFEKDIKPVALSYKAKYPDKPPRSLTYLNDRISSSIAQRNKPMPEVKNGQNIGYNQSGKLQKADGKSKYELEADRIKAGLIAEFEAKRQANFEGLPSLPAPIN